jgi:hypothetical protein
MCQDPIFRVSDGDSVDHRQSLFEFVALRENLSRDIDRSAIARGSQKYLLALIPSFIEATGFEQLQCAKRSGFLGSLFLTLARSRWLLGIAAGWLIRFRFAPDC